MRFSRSEYCERWLKMSLFFAFANTIECCVKESKRAETALGKIEYRQRLSRSILQTIVQKESALPAKRKPTTRATESSTSEAVSLPEQEAFRLHARRLAVSAAQAFLAHVLCEELEQCIGASWGACIPTLRGYRNGSSTRDLLTATGGIADLNVPRDREGAFQTQAFERDQRDEPEVAEALTQLFVSGVSTHDVGKVLETLTGGAQCQGRQSPQSDLDGAIETWRGRSLLDPSRVVSLDGVHFTVRHGEPTDATMIFTTLGGIWQAAAKYGPFVPARKRAQRAGWLCCKSSELAG
jgi:hypothetical protein